MKKIVNIISLSIVILIAGCTSTRNVETSDPQTYNQNYTQQVSYSQFYEGLNPYGRWIDYPGYGNVWVPMDEGFRPYYSNGHWAYTNYGWTWVSGYQWGWAPFHYGRWFHDNSYGWMWTPGYEWAPAWVNWRSDNQYYGWAPIGPGGRYNEVDDDDWAFVNHEHLNDRNLNNYYINHQYNRNIINNTTVVNNNVGVRKFNPGPSLKEVESVTNSRIRPLKIEQTAAPVVSTVNNGTLTIYKPSVINNNSGAPRSISPSNQPVQLPGRRILPSPVNEEMPINTRVFPSGRPINSEPVKKDLNRIEPRKPVMLDNTEPIINMNPAMQKRQQNIQREIMIPGHTNNPPVRTFPQPQVVRERPAFPMPQPKPAFNNPTPQQPVYNTRRRKADGSIE